MNLHCDVAVIGGGPAGMAAAVSARQNGAGRVLLLEQQDFLGGVLPQCVHDGFGLRLFKTSLSGPEYARRYINRIAGSGVEVHLGTSVTSLATTGGCAPAKPPGRGGQSPLAASATTGGCAPAADKTVICAGGTLGWAKISAKAVIVATGCKEKTRGGLRIPGSRPSGVYTAGAAQFMVNIQNYLPGRSVVILGLGDIGLIMARRLTLEGVRVKLALGLEATGLQRNMAQCVYDFGIPLKVGYTVVSVHGAKRLKGVTIARAGVRGLTDAEYVPCDTLLLSAGLVPETALLTGLEMERSAGGGPAVDECGRTSVAGVFACGNVVGTHDLVDDVTLEAEAVGFNAAAWLRSVDGGGAGAFREKPEFASSAEPKGLPDLPPDAADEKHRLCLICPRCCVLNLVRSRRVSDGGWIVSGNACARGAAYGLQEMIGPLRVVTTTVKIAGGKKKLLPVRTDAMVPRDKTGEVMKLCGKITLSGPVAAGGVIIADVAGTGVNVVACDDNLN